jgi:epoxyqueuosine reductase
VSEADRARLEANPNLFLETVIKAYVANSPENRLPAYDNDLLVGEPLIGFADGNDPIFHEFKKKGIIGAFHFTPEEAFSTYLKRQQKNVGDKKPHALSVVSIIFTATRKTRLSNRPETVMGSPRWQYAFDRGITFMEDTLKHLVSRLEALGYQAVAPMYTRPLLFLWQLPDGPTSDWSEKHIAYAAGLGTFGLNGGIITTRGAALHCGSVITDVALTPTPRAYDNYLAHCLYFRNGSCGRCIERCPSGAISERGYDSRKCFFYHEVDLPRISKNLGREPEGGDHPPVCSLCQTKVPCENRIPSDTSANGRREEKS